MICIKGKRKSRSLEKKKLLMMNFMGYKVSVFKTLPEIEIGT